MGCAGPVSYTHLDVYKRQGLLSPVWFQCGNFRPKHMYSEYIFQHRLELHVETEPSLPYQALKIFICTFKKEFINTHMAYYSLLLYKLHYKKLEHCETIIVSH